ncbi:MAG: hypothetical protein U1G07_13235 [Verrucomicrobiota bacterium]
MMITQTRLLAVRSIPQTLANRLIVSLLVFAGIASAGTVLFETGFEAGENYFADALLTGQNGWIGSGADGILYNFFGDNDQQATVGYPPPLGDTNDFHYVYHPINFVPKPDQSVVTFSVFQEIVDSSASDGPWDSFRWSVYNTRGDRLFSIEFDNASLFIFYLLDDGGDFISTDRRFEPNGQYDLVVSMNFGRNLWSATLNDEIIINSQPITTIRSPLTLGDIDAIWFLANPAVPGDNFMVFDDYRVVAESAASIAPRLETRGKGTNGQYLGRLYGEAGLVYRIETSSDLQQWSPLLNLTAPASGILDFEDSTARTAAQRFFRARQVP